MQAVLDTIAYWISHVFDADRASITLQDTEEYLKLYSISGNHAIPMDFKIPIGQTFVGTSLRPILNSSFAMTLLSRMSWIAKCFQSMAWAPYGCAHDSQWRVYWAP